GPGHCAQHQNVGVKQIVPGAWGGTCASAGLVKHAHAIPAHNNAILNDLMGFPYPYGPPAKREFLLFAIDNCTFTKMQFTRAWAERYGAVSDTASSLASLSLLRYRCVTRAAQCFQPWTDGQDV
ncbi:MAG TPA: hypothetical protein VIZ90_15760, partial [Rhizobiaceae bacterium]